MHRSTDRGDSWERISPDLTTNDAGRLAGNVPHCTITTISESPVRRGVVWVGTDDGRVHVTQDGGRHWRDLTEYFPDAVRGLWVSRVVASAHDKGKAWVSFTGYREDRFDALLFVTDDFGGTWAPRTAGLSTSPVNVVREDRRNADLVFVGTEHGALASLDGGDTWHPLDDGIPAVPVHDLVVHERTGDLVVGTHAGGSS